MMHYAQRLAASIGQQAAPTQVHPADVALMTAQLRQEFARQAAITAAQAAVDGDFPDPLIPEEGEPTDQVKVNLMGALVDVTGYFLFGQPPTFELPAAQDGEDGPTVSAQEAWLTECHRRNNLAAFLLDAAHNGATGGTVYVRVDPAPHAPSPADPHPHPTYRVLDSGAMTIEYDPANISCITGYVYSYNAGSASWGVPVQRRVITRRLETGWATWEEENRAGQAAGWQAVSAPVPWPYEWPPILHCKNLPAPNCVYGRPDVTPNLVGLNRALNFNLSNRQLIDFYHGHPTKYVKGMTLAELPRSVRNVLEIRNPNGMIGELAPSGNSATGETLANEIRAAISEESATPGLVLGRETDLGNASGVALLVRLWPLQMKTQAKRALYEPWLVELNRRLFELGAWGAARLVNVTWPNLIPMDRLAQVQTLTAEITAGLTSKATASAELGRDYDHEQDNIAAEAATPAPGRDPAPSSIGDAAPLDRVDLPLHPGMGG
jgi:hypothetical protein